MEKRVRVVLKGVTPLLQNRNKEADLTKIKKKNETQKDSPEREDVFTKTYHHDNGKVYQPAEHIIRMLQTIKQCPIDCPRIALTGSAIAI